MYVRPKATVIVTAIDPEIKPPRIVPALGIIFKMVETAFFPKRVALPDMVFLLLLDPIVEERIWDIKAVGISILYMIVIDVSIPTSIGIKTRQSEKGMGDIPVVNANAAAPIAFKDADFLSFIDVI